MHALTVLCRSRYAQPLHSIPKEYLRQSTKKSIRPDLCPAIREYSKLGFYLASPYPLRLKGTNDFDILIYEKPDGEVLLCPGVIGNQASDTFYARVDTGLSVLDLAGPFIVIGIQDVNFVYRGLNVPATLYPAGYSGPILVPISSDAEVEIPPAVPIAHCIPLSENAIMINTVRSDVTHVSFEGLIDFWWDDHHQSGKQMSAFRAVQTGISSTGSVATEPVIPS